MTISGTLAYAPSILTLSSADGPTVFVRLNEYPSVIFDVRGVKYRALKADLFVTRVQIGDSIRLQILRDEYVNKLGTRVATVEPYSIEVRNRNYMSLPAVNAAWKEEQVSDRRRVLWLVVGLAVAGALICLIFYRAGVARRSRM
ncbi:MAG TPA: hypothetical protein VHD83_27120 [Puia sp.]|nr:hypothetical protein [Puia sp.]